MEEVKKIGESNRKIYSGWMKNDYGHCLFTTLRENLEPGDIITDAFGKKWEIDIIF